MNISNENCYRAAAHKELNSSHFSVSPGHCAKQMSLQQSYVMFVHDLFPFPAFVRSYRQMVSFSPSWFLLEGEYF